MTFEDIIIKSRNFNPFKPGDTARCLHPDTEDVLDKSLAHTTEGKDYLVVKSPPYTDPSCDHITIVADDFSIQNLLHARFIKVVDRAEVAKECAEKHSNWIAAAKAFRTETGCTIREAKAALDPYTDEHFPTRLKKEFEA